MGALYAEAMPPAAPQATSSRSRAVGSLIQRPTSDAMTAASCTRGPSRPMEPPDEIVNAAEAHFTKLDRAESIPWPSTMASM